MSDIPREYVWGLKVMKTGGYSTAWAEAQELAVAFGGAEKQV